MSRSARAHGGQETALQGDHDRVSSIASSQAMEDGFKMRLDRVGREEEPVGNLAVGETSADALEDFELALGQGRSFVPLVANPKAASNRLGNLRVQIHAATGNHPRSLEKLLASGGLDKIALGAQLQGLDDALLIVMNAEDQHAHRARQPGSHVSQEQQSVVLSQVQVQQNQIAFEGGQLLPGRFQSRRTSREIELGGLGENSFQSIADQLVVINDV